jgi:hypothetical protein
MDANKYTEAVRLVNHCQDVTDVKELHRRLDIFFAHLCDNFPVPDATDPAQVNACAALLRGPASELEAAVREIPPAVEDVLYPVALMKVALQIYRIPLQPIMAEKFDQFHKAYYPLIDKAGRHITKPYVPEPKTAEQAQDS